MSPRTASSKSLKAVSGGSRVTPVLGLKMLKHSSREIKGSNNSLQWGFAPHGERLMTMHKSPLQPRQTQTMLMTSEMMEEGKTPLLFTGGACNIQGLNGAERNPGRDPLAAWLDSKGWSYFDPQIHPSTHGRDYVWGIDGPKEKLARAQAKLRIYEITATTIAAVTMLEIMDDARVGRTSIAWFNRGQTFEPIGLGGRDELSSNIELKHQVGDSIHSHLLAYVNAGRQVRSELQLMLADCQNIVFVNSFDELKTAVSHLMSLYGI